VKEEEKRKSKISVKKGEFTNSTSPKLLLVLEPALPTGISTSVQARSLVQITPTPTQNRLAMKSEHFLFAVLSANLLLPPACLDYLWPSLFTGILITSRISLKSSDASPCF